MNKYGWRTRAGKSSRQRRRGSVGGLGRPSPILDKGGLMPKLSDEKRADIERRQAIHQRIMDSFKPNYMSQQCHFCGWASNGLTIDEAIAENTRHEASHPEAAEYDAANLSIKEIIACLHDHDCEMIKCQCKCGCTVGPFCAIPFGPLCSYCTTRAGRRDNEHGKRGQS